MSANFSIAKSRNLKSVEIAKTQNKARNDNGIEPTKWKLAKIIATLEGKSQRKK